MPPARPGNLRWAGEQPDGAPGVTPPAGVATAAVAVDLAVATAMTGVAVWGCYSESHPTNRALDITHGHASLRLLPGRIY